MDQSQIAPILTAFTTLIAAITALIAVLHNGGAIKANQAGIKQIAHQTDGVLDHLQAQRDAAAAHEATAVELAARPDVPDPAPTAAKTTNIGT